MKLADPDAKELVETLDNVTKSKHDQTMVLVEKDISSLKDHHAVRFNELESRMDLRFRELETRMDLKFRELESRMDVRFRELEARMDARVNELKSWLMTRFEEMDKRYATKSDVADTKAEIIKWMFIFWVGQIIATFGFILLFLKK